jgi:Gamma-glutamyl cyclotransferase, AIG2-like
MSSHSTAAPRAPINPVANKLHHVFGYGSLAAEHERCPVARLGGFRRTWGVAMDNSVDVPGYKSYRLRCDASRPAVYVAFVDIERDPQGAVTGVLMPVDVDDLAALDHRERNYDRIDVTAQVDDAAGRVWAYRGSQAGRARLREGLAAGRAVVSRDYLENVLAGLATIAPCEVGHVRPADLPVLDLERVEIPPT